MLAVGPGKRSERSGDLIPLDLKVGDTVVYSKYGGTEITIEGEDLLILSAPRRARHREEVGMAKQLRFRGRRPAALEVGVDKLAKTVGITLGPKGRNVVIDKKFGAPTITNDGVSIAKEIDIADNVENIGAQMLREVAKQDQRRGR